MKTKFGNGELRKASNSDRRRRSRTMSIHGEKLKFALVKDIKSKDPKSIDEECLGVCIDAGSFEKPTRIKVCEDQDRVEMHYTVLHESIHAGSYGGTSEFETLQLERYLGRLLLNLGVNLGDLVFPRKE